jgi:polyhydroxyalkanoate synthase subunit PhaC
MPRKAAAAQEAPAPDRPVLDMLGVAENAAGTADPVSFGRALFAAGRSLALNPVGAGAVAARTAQAFGAAALATGQVLVGREAKAPAAPEAGDRRFADPAFTDNPWYFWLAQSHLLTERHVMELLEVADLDPLDAIKARFAAKFVLDALAPTNVLAGNPAALREALSTGGKSVARGIANWADDVVHNGGWPKQVDASGFEVGRNMAATPGKVVYRSDLIELIQYAPQTDEVHEIPLLFCPPWINKYYIMDLAPGKSLIEWAVQHGHTCFAISYRNPDASMRDVSFTDYLKKGPLAAIDVVKQITGAERVNTLSVCLGGTLSAIGLAYDAREGRKSVNAATFLNAHTDFTIPGTLGVFTDESTVAGLEKKMAKQGYLDARDMARTFDALRANDLVFGYVVNNWLLGKQPPAFDLLAWNNDSTRMPAKMHSRYLRSCYLNNEFSQGRFEVDGAPVDPGATDLDTYVLAAVEDHIVPWHSAYKTTQILGGRHRFVLSGGGHIAGIVNPPRPKAEYWAHELPAGTAGAGPLGDSVPADPDAWLKAASHHKETWWEDWARWIGTRAGKKVRARKELGSSVHAPLEDAPGSYVRVRV